MNVKTPIDLVSGTSIGRGHCRSFGPYISPATSCIQETSLKTNHVCMKMQSPNQLNLLFSLRNGHLESPTGGIWNLGTLLMQIKAPTMKSSHEFLVHFGSLLQTYMKWINPEGKCILNACGVFL